MAKISVKRFVELLQKSNLVPDMILRDALTQIKKENLGEPLADTGFVTRRLIEMDLITSWQCDKLLSQKYKGFFLGKYKILGHIGTGGMSSVYLVEHMQMHQRRAIKVLPRKRVTDKTYLERFYIEARASASLEHPNIVRAFDVDHDEGSETHYLIMEYVDGRDVGKIIEEDGPINPRDAASYIAQAAEALQFAHDQGVVHRDVKPGNLLVDRNNEVKILDMGLALFKEDEYSLTLEYNEKILGTADYLAPEQAMNSHEVDHRADIYGLGCTLYFMLAGQPPFNEGTLAQRIVKHQTQKPPSMETHRSDCPRELQMIMEHMMVKNPKKRFQTCNDVARICTDWLAGRPIQIPSVNRVPIAPDGNSAQAGTAVGDSDVLNGDDRTTTLPRQPEGESVTASTDDTIRHGQNSAENLSSVPSSSSSSSSHSKIKLTAVSFSDIVAGSSIDGDGTLQTTSVPGPDPASLPAKEPATNETPRRTSIEISPAFLVSIVLFSVFVSSAFTVLILDWLKLLGN
ncbi:MAG: serine/threonine-protein kinase [Planctomycetota bacterium]|nr:serine/threonine-protein kinase [Planctomycetota bacterium]